MNNDVVSQAIVKLFLEERFYAEIISQMKRILSDKVPVAGVCVKDRIELHLNPETFGVLLLDERVAILKHECEHILRDHIARSKIVAPEVYAHSANKNMSDNVADNLINSAKHQCINIAADCAINGTLKGLPKGACYPKTFDLINGQTMEWYLAQLKYNEKAKDFMEVDGHELWAESEGDKEMLREKIRQAVNEAAKNTRQAGRMTAEHELLVSSLNIDTSVNWRDQLKRFVAKTIETTVESSKKKRNRRYGIMYPGYIKTEELHIGVAIDTSGSTVWALNQFMAEIGNIAKYARVSVIEIDTEVKAAYEYNPKKDYKLKGGGGTAYKPAFDHFNDKKNEVDALIYFGDGDCYDGETLVKPKYPLLWALVGEHAPPAEFGSVIRVKVKNE